MPQFNTSLDRFYKTTAHWDPWNKYRELINDENVNNAKSQVITRQFNGVKQYQEERKRITEGDKLIVVDINKNVEKFKKAIKDAETNLEEAKKDPLNDLFFSYNSLMIAYKTLVDTSSKNSQLLSPSLLSEIKSKIDSAVPQLEELLSGLRKKADELYLDEDPDETVIANEKTIIKWTVYLQDMVDNIKSGLYGTTIDINDKKRKIVDEYYQRNLQDEIQVLENDVYDRRFTNKKKVFSEFDKRIKSGEQLQRSEGAVGFDRSGDNNDDLTLYEEFQGEKAKIRKQVLEDIDQYLITDTTNSDYFKNTQRALLEGKSLKFIKYRMNRFFPDFKNVYLDVADDIIDGYGKKDGLLNRTLNPVESLQKEIQGLYLKRNSLIKQSTNKNLDKIEYEKINHGIHLLQRQILQKTDLLRGKSVYELNRMLDNKQFITPTGEPQKVAPKGFQFVVDPTTGQTVLKPVVPEGQKKKEDIQPMIMNAQQIIADEYGVYMKNQAKTASDDELKVKQESSASAIIPLFKAIFKTRPDEVQALHAAILDPVWKKMLLDRMPEINLPQPFTPPPPAPPKPDDKPVEPPKPDDKPIEPAKDRNKLQADITAKLKEILPIYDDWDQSESSNLTTLYSQIANICNSVLDLLETGRKGGLNVKVEISLDAIGGNNVLNDVKTELWDNYTKGTRWNEGKDVKVPSPFEFTQEIERLVKIMTGHNDEFEQMNDQGQNVTEKTIFDRIRPEADELIKYLMKGQKWFPRQVYLRFKMDFGKNINEAKHSGMDIINDTYAKLYNLIWNHADDGTMFTDVGTEGTKKIPKDPLSPSEKRMEIKGYYDELQNKINDLIEAEANDENVNQTRFNADTLTQKNKIIEAFKGVKDQFGMNYYVGNSKNIIFTIMDEVFRNIGAYPAKFQTWTNSLLSDIRKQANDYQSPYTPAGFGKKGGNNKRAMNIEKIRASEFLAESFKGLKKPKEGVVIPDPRAKPFVLKNPKSRVNVKSEGSGILTKSNVSTKRQELLKNLGMGMVCEDESSSDSEKEGGAGKKGGKMKIGHRKKKPTFTEI